MDPWRFLIVGYLVSICLETPVLLVGLSRRHSLGRRLFAGLWLTACTYPAVVLIFPLLFDPFEERTLYLWVAEAFAHVGECILFWAAFILNGGPGAAKAGAVSTPPPTEAPAERWRRILAGGDWRATLQDMAAVLLANLTSFGLFELAYRYKWISTDWLTGGGGG
jgi:hypothetical protein